MSFVMSTAAPYETEDLWDSSYRLHILNVPMVNLFFVECIMLL